MSDYISRDAAIDAIFGQFCASSDETEAALNSAVEDIKSIPAADVRPVARAAWQSWEQDKPPCKWYSCDYCGFHALSKSNYCPSCGADMRAEEGE